MSVTEAEVKKPSKTISCLRGEYNYPEIIKTLKSERKMILKDLIFSGLIKYNDSVTAVYNVLVFSRSRKKQS